MGLGLGFGPRKAGAGGGGDVTGPVVTSIVWDTATDPDNPLLTWQADEDYTLRALTSGSATPMSAPAIQSGAVLVQPMTAGEGFLDYDDSGDPPGSRYLHWSLTDLSGNATVPAPLGYTKAAPGPFASVFDGTNDWLHTTGLAAPAGSKQGALIFTFRVPTIWPVSGFLCNFRGSLGGKVNVQFTRDTSGGSTVRGRLFVTLRDAAASSIGSLAFADATFLVDTWYTVLISWDTATQTWVTRKRVGGGSWVTPTYAGVPSLTLNAIIDTTPDAVIGASDSAGLNRPTGWEASEVWYAPSQLPDFTNAAIQTAFEPLTNKGATGALPTGTAPLIYLGNPTATFHINKVTGTPMTVAGALTVAGTTPT